MPRAPRGSQLASSRDWTERVGQHHPDGGGGSRFPGEKRVWAPGTATPLLEASRTLRVRPWVGLETGPCARGGGADQSSSKGVGRQTPAGPGRLSPSNLGLER